MVILASALAFAAGRVSWASTTLKERENKSWRVEVKIFLPGPPDVAHLPMKFEFEPIAYYERSMVDGDKLLERTVPLEGRQPLIESVDVGFMDPSSGKVQSRTLFTFKVTRAHGYEAGEYRVTIRDSRNGRLIGAATTLKFEGDNEVIDRRSIVFSGEKKKKKEEPKPEAAGSSDTEGGDDTGEAGDDAEEESYDDEAEYADDDGADGPPPIEEKPGGCGCRTAGARGSVAYPLLALFFLPFLRRRGRVSVSQR
jgi:MYXO-CTERM domain-containing protein